MFGISLKPRPPTPLLLEKIPKLPYYGSLPRVTSIKKPEFVNQHFIDWALKRKIPVFNDSFRVPDISLENSYTEVGKYFNDKEIKVDEFFYRRALQLTFDHYSVAVRDSKPISYDEVKRKASPQSSTGYPENLWYVDKEDMFLNNPNDVEDFETYYNSLITDCPYPTLFANSMKWELRKFGKPPRTFFAGSWHLYAAKKIWTQDQDDACVKNHDKIWSAVGMSPFHGGWHRMISKLIRVGGKNPLFIESDMSNWDRSLPSWLMWSVFKIRYLLLDPKYRDPKLKVYQRLAAIYDATINAFIIMEDGSVIRKFGGMPSGDANTIGDNGIAHTFVLMYALTKIYFEKTSKILTLSQINESFWFRLMGDDQLGVVNLDSAKWFSLEALHKIYGELGLTCKKIKTASEVTEVEFLSKNTRRFMGMYMPFPNADKVWSSFAYGNKSADYRIAYQRLLSIRMECWPDDDLFAKVDAYCDSFFNTFKNYLIGEDGVVSATELMAQKKTKSQLYSLWIMPEGKSLLKTECRREGEAQADLSDQNRKVDVPDQKGGPKHQQKLLSKSKKLLRRRRKLLSKQ